MREEGRQKAIESVGVYWTYICTFWVLSSFEIIRDAFILGS